MTSPAPEQDPKAQAPQTFDDSAQLPAEFLAARRKIKRGKLIKRSVLAVVVAGVVIGAGCYFLGQGSGDGEQPSVQTYTQAVQKGDLDLTVEGSGTLAASSTTNVNANVSGTVKKVYVQQGDKVKKGAVLFTMTSDTLSDAVSTAAKSKSKAYSSYASALSELSSAKTALAKAKASAKKQAKSASSAPGGAGSQSSSSTDSSSAVQSAQEAVTQAKQSVSQAKSSYDDAVSTYDDAVDALDDLTVKAANAGTVSAVNITKGDVVDASSSSSSSAVTISGLNKMSLSMNVSEYDVGKLKAGQSATVTVTALEKDVDATVKSVSSTASDSTDGSTAYYSAVLEIPSPVDGMLEGMNATVKVVYQSYEDALLVPTSAVSTQGDSSTVTVQGSDGANKQVSVEVLGSTDETSAVSSDSLAEGDAVVVSYQVSTDTDSSSSQSAAAGFGAAMGSGGEGASSDAGAAQGGGQGGPGGDGGQGGAPGGGQGGAPGGGQGASGQSPSSGN